MNFSSSYFSNSDDLLNKIRNNPLFKQWHLAFLLAIISYYLLSPVWQSGILVGGDWIFPYTQEQLYEFYNNSKTYWHFRELPTGSPLPHHNIYPFELLAGIFYFFDISGIAFQKILISIVTIGVGLISFYAFNKITKNSFASLLAAIAYLFSPIYFDYLSMGWIFVLLFMALLPLIVLLVDSYFNNAQSKTLIAIGLITSIAFAQSQAIVWVPLVVITFAISHWVSGTVSIGKVLSKLLILLIGIMSIVFIVHMFWIIPAMSGASAYEGAKSISVYDFSRFNVLNALNLIRDWGGVYNKQFEIAFNSDLLLFSFFSPIVLGLLFIRNVRSNRYAVFALLLVILPFALFLAGAMIAELPFANIIRDFNRFMVLSNFGYALAIALVFAKINSIGFRLLGLICLLISVHPFLDQSLYQWNESQGINTAPRFLNNPDNEIEKRIDQYSGSRNLLMPTGAHIGTLNDRRFKNPYAELADLDASFSPNATGIYVSDKSPPLILNFADQYIHSAMKDKEAFFLLSRIYGINNVLIRKGLYSSYDRGLNSNLLNDLGCKAVQGSKTTDFSISKVCNIDDSYPIIYSPARVIESKGNDIVDVVRSENLSLTKEHIAIIGCPSDISFKDTEVCAPKVEINTKLTTPRIEFTKIEETKYLVDVSEIAGNYMLVLNQTIHDGWRIKDANTETDLKYKKILVNHLVNGWLVTTDKNLGKQEFIIEFTPKGASPWLRYISLAFLAILFVLTIYLRPKSDGAFRKSQI